jgi:hypothetical protein
VDFGRWAIVRFRLAAAAAFLMFLRAAFLCFSLGMFFPQFIHDGSAYTENRESTSGKIH